MDRIGILGGTFHPFHNGHLLLGKYCLKHAGLDEIWYIPTGYSYFKEGQVMLSGEDRLHLVSLGIQGEQRMKVLDIEIKRDGPTYTYETLQEILCLYPDKALYLILGADCLFDLEKWKNISAVFCSCTILAAAREDKNRNALECKAQELIHKYDANIEILDFPEVELSSTDIRNRVAEGLSITGMVPPAVENEILKKGYFRTRDKETEEILSDG